MISADPPKVSDDMATSSASFSYAQAAKGQGNSSNPNAVVPPSSTVDSTASNKSTASEHSAETTDVTQSVDTSAASSENKDRESIADSEIDSKAKSASDTASQPRQEEGVSRLEQPWRRNDKSTRSSSAATRDESDNRRKRNKKNKNSDKQSTEQTTAEKAKEQEPEPPKIELSEAPIPTVNIWQQRQVALSSKVVPVVQKPLANITNGVPSQATEVTQSAKPVEATATTEHTQKSTRKSGENTRPERNGSRGNRETKNIVPPPVGDAAAWPTPETSTAEDKKKGPVEKSAPAEKDKESDDGQSKPKQKKGWVTYDYVPTVSFETQMPSLRGAKPRTGPRGANGPRSSNNNQSGEKTSTPATAKSGEPKERQREVVNGTTEPASAPPLNKKAPVEAAPSREQKKAAAPAVSEKPKEALTSQNTVSVSNTVRHSSLPERKNGGPAHELMQPKEQVHTPRDRQEGRVDRGRGGYRGRGGHNGMNSHSHGTSTNPSGFPPPNPMGQRTRGHYSPPSRTPSQTYPNAPRGGGRGSHNSSNNNNFHRMSLPNGRPPPVQTQFQMPYDYPIVPMSAVQYPTPPYWDSMIAATLKNQIEYYFSVENLCKDVYLRKRMDSQGFVPLHFIAGFRRVRDLSNDLMLLRAVCEDSAEIDFVVGEDEAERLRRRHGWEKFVMPKEDRDELARSDGPVQLTYRNRSYGFGQQPAFNNMPPMVYGAAPPQAFTPPGDQKFQQPIDDGRNGHMANGHMANGHVNGVHDTTQLSAEVPDFAPSGAPLFHNPLKPNNGHSGQNGMNGGSSNGLVNGYGHSSNAQSWDDDVSWLIVA